MIKICPHVIHVHLVDVIDRLSSVARDERATQEAAVAEPSLTQSSLVLLHLSPNHHRLTLSAFHLHVVQQTSCKLAQTRFERLIATESAGIQVRNAFGAKEMATRDAFAWICEYLFANGTFQFVVHLEVTEIFIVLKIKQNIIYSF